MAVTKVTEEEAIAEEEAPEPAQQPVQHVEVVVVTEAEGATVPHPRRRSLAHQATTHKLTSARHKAADARHKAVDAASRRLEVTKKVMQGRGRAFLKRHEIKFAAVSCAYLILIFLTIILEDMPFTTYDMEGPIEMVDSTQADSNPASADEPELC